MDKLLLGLSLLCLTWTISGRICVKCRKRPQLKDADKILKCRTCKYMPANRVCLSGEGTCTAKRNETCLTQRFFSEGTMQFVRLMCKENCESKKIQNNNQMVKQECCEGRNFCNYL